MWTPSRRNAEIWLKPLQKERIPQFKIHWIWMLLVRLFPSFVYVCLLPSWFFKQRVGAKIRVKSIDHWAILCDIVVFFRKKSTVLRPKKVVEFARLTSEARILMSFFSGETAWGVTNKHVSPWTESEPIQTLAMFSLFSELTILNGSYVLFMSRNIIVDIVRCKLNCGCSMAFLVCAPQRMKSCGYLYLLNLLKHPKILQIHKNIATLQSFRVLIFWRWSEMIMTLSFCVFFDVDWSFESPVNARHTVDPGNLSTLSIPHHLLFEWMLFLRRLT